MLAQMRVFISLAACVLAVGTLQGQVELVTFGQDVLPILERRCAVCHWGDNAQKGLRVTSAVALLEGGASGPAVVAGSPGESLLLARIVGEEPSMPPTGERLTASEVETIRRWIESGADHDSDAEQPDGGAWWSLRPWPIVQPPAVNNPWARTDIDRFIIAGLDTHGLSPSPAADRRTLILSVTFDLLGLPPTPERVESFVADSAPDAYERLVEELLEDPAYGERWGRHWLDVVRFGESNGYEQNHLRKNAWPYRDWVIDSFNEDKPFNRMIIEQLAGDQIAPGDPSVEAATGFLVAGPHDTVRIQNPEGEAQKRANHLDDMVTATASSFLGLTVHCARCHDHKFDPIKQKDYYRMQAAFAGVWHDERVWARAEEVAAYEQAAQPLRAELQTIERAFEVLRKASDERVAAKKEQILDGFRPGVDPVGTEEIFSAVEALWVRLTIEEPTAGRNVVDLDELEVWTVGPASRNVALKGRIEATSTRVDEASPDTYAAANLIDGKFDKRWIYGF